MTRGSSALVSITLVFIVLTVGLGTIRALFVWMSGDEVERGTGGLRQLWLTWLEMTDPGTQAYDIDSSGGVKVFAVLAGIGGIILLSAVIAVMTTSLTAKIQQLQAGHSRVLESDHTLILGWNDRILDILNELIEANESEPTATVVVLADRPKVDMDEYISSHVDDRRTTRIVTRSGVPASNHDLDTAAPEAAKSAIILRSDDDSSNSATLADIAVIKTIMALLLCTRDECETAIIAELADPDNAEIAQTLAPDRLTVVQPDSMLAQVIVQCSRTRGLSPVYREILSFDGAELYLEPYALPEPMDFGDVGWHLPDGIPLGVASKADGLTIHPTVEHTVAPGDSVLILAEDDSTIDLRPTRYATGVLGAMGSGGHTRRQERCLVIGWTSKTPAIIEELDDYVAAGSRVDVVTRNPEVTITRTVDELNEALPRLEITLRTADPHRPDGLEQLEPAGYDNVILLNQPSPHGTGGEDTDGETLTILLRLRRLLAADANGSTKLISEVVEASNEEVVKEVGVDDVVISNRIVSSVIAQLSEDPGRDEIFAQLFAEEGSEMYLKPAPWYVGALPWSGSFADLMAHAHEREEIAIGYRTAACGDRLDQNFGITLNPDKRRELTLTADDYVVVMAVDER